MKNVAPLIAQLWLRFGIKRESTVERKLEILEACYELLQFLFDGEVTWAKIPKYSQSKVKYTIIKK